MKPRRGYSDNPLTGGFTAAGYKLRGVTGYLPEYDSGGYLRIYPGSNLGVFGHLPGYGTRLVFWVWLRGVPGYLPGYDSGSAGYLTGYGSKDTRASTRV